MIRLLLFSHDTAFRVVLQSALGGDFQLHIEGDPDMARTFAMQRRCDVVILDVAAADAAEHLDLFEEVRQFRIPVVVMTGDEGRETAAELIQKGAHGCCRRPPVVTELKTAVRRAYEYGMMKRDLEQIGHRAAAAAPALPEGCDQLIGSSARLRHVYDLIHRVARLDASVLVTGESGTGKELIARALHNLSDRKLAPFVAVSCGAIPETLIEAELFGCEKGAFTGAVNSRRGYLEQAGRGTLFLDEIGELSPHTQVRLLRVLQEKQFSRLGSSAVMPLQARVVFATHRNLAKMVEAGDFRLDLYYRINVMGIRMPALRDHSEDISVLARHFVEKYAAEYRKPVAAIAPGAMTLLVEHQWPGNVRELENVIQKAIIVTDEDTIGPEHLPENLQQPDLLGVGDALANATFEDQLRDYKIRIAQKAIEDCRGNKTLAARSLNISRTYLHRLIREPEEITLQVA